MELRSIKINYYKNIKECLSLDFLPINIFIGQNNVGKSNILDAIEFALDANAKNDRKLFYAKTDIELNLLFTEGEKDKFNLPAARASFIFKNQERKLVFADKELAYSKALANILRPRIKRLDEQAFLDLGRIQDDFQRLYSYPGQLEKFISNLKNHFPKISASKNALDVDFQHHGLYEGKRRVTIDRLGSGFRRIFTILLYVFHPDYPVVFIDEPETHLHPAMVKKLLWAMQNSQAGQILFTTHSPLFITPMTLPQVVRVVKDDKSTHAFSLAKIKYDYKRLIQELNADNLEMFFADKVILVEGISDKLLIRGLIDKFYEGDKDIKVIQTHGKGNMKLYSYLLNICNIPFVIVLDRDAIRSNHTRELMQNMGIKLPTSNPDELINALKSHNIYIFPNGELEANYPRKFQIDDSKSLNALRAASAIVAKDYNSKRMINLKEIISNL